MLSLSAGPARQTWQNFGRSGKFSFVPDCMSDIKLPVKHTSLYIRSAKHSASLTKFASLPDLLSSLIL